ncbi:MAG: RraA family protein [Hyphomicrobiaceae bacterium]
MRKGTATMIDVALVQRLAKFDTPTICNALEIVDPESRSKGFTKRPLICPFPDLPPFIGYARTASIRATHPHELAGAEAREQRLSYYEYVANGGPSPSIAVIQDLDGVDIGFGCFWGEVQSAVHKGLGCAGVITDGGIRDVPQWAPGLPVLAGSIVPSHGHVHLADFGREVRVAGMVVRSGDLIHADSHGAVVIPTDCAEKIPNACDLLERREAVILDIARAPGFTIKQLRQALQRQDEIH